MEHVRSFDGFPALPELQAFLAAQQDAPFATSELYSSKVDAKIIDEDKRKSHYRLFQDCEIFDLVDRTVQWLNESDKEYVYQLRRDDITETRYEKQGFFLKHKDYISVTSNLIEEFTLILCVTPLLEEPAVGGETLIFPYASEKGVSFDTTTPGNGLVFRKDLEHAGNVLQAGEKHILTANLWATRKQASNQVLFVAFPSSSEEDRHEKVASLQQAASQDTSYALPVDSLKGTMLDAHVRFVNQGYEQNDQELPAVVTYQCTDFSFEEFGTVAKILQRSYVHEDDISRHANCIEFFGPFLKENLLVNLSLEKALVDDAEEKPSCQRFVKSSKSDAKLPAKKSKSAKKLKTNGDDDPKEDTDDLDVIVCENESRTQVVNQVALQLGFHSYVPFKMLFVEGIIQTLPEGTNTDIPVTPVALLLGDYNHVFAIRKVGGSTSVDSCTLREFHEKRNYWADENATWLEGNGEVFGAYEDDWEAYAEGRGFSLKFALGEDPVRDRVTSFVFESLMSGGNGFSCFQPLSDYSGTRRTDSDAESEEEETEEEEPDEQEPSSPRSLFHRDESGKATFMWKEATATSNFIASMNLDEHVKACIQKKRFEIPQESEDWDDYYCNESAYANFNVLFVTGVVRLDPTASVTAEATQKFDAWPTWSQKKASRRKANKYWSDMGVGGYFSHYDY